MGNYTVSIKQVSQVTGEHVVIETEQIADKFMALAVWEKRVKEARSLPNAYATLDSSWKTK